MADGVIRQRQAFAQGSHTPGYGHMSVSGGGRNPGYAKGGSVKTANNRTMDGGIGAGAHGHTHKSHGHGLGVQHQKTGGVGEGGASSGKSQSGCCGPSDNQFGQKMPSGNGSTLGRW